MNRHKSTEVTAIYLDRVAVEAGRGQMTVQRMRARCLSYSATESNECPGDVPPMRANQRHQPCLSEPLFKPAVILPAEIHLQLPAQADSLRSRSTRAMHTKKIAASGGKGGAAEA